MTSPMRATAACLSLSGFALQAGKARCAAALDAHCRTLLAAYKVPRHYAFVDDLPRTSTGKIMRRSLRDAPHRQSDKESLT